MKKSFLMLGLAVAALSSCTNDEVVEVNQSTQKVIGFESFVNKGTRAVTPTTNDITKFYAYGYYGTGNDLKSLWTDGVAVGRTTTNTPWSYYTTDDKSNQRFWTKNTYQFGAYANANTGNALSDVTFGEGTSTVELVIPDYTVNDANDLVADIVTVDYSENTTLGNATDVNFNFEHLLTKIQFKIINTDPQFNMRITEPLTINYVYKKGTCTVSKDPNPDKTELTKSWAKSADATTNTYIPNFINDENGSIVTTENISAANEAGYIAPSTGTIVSDELFVMPQSLSAITFTIKAVYYDSDGQIVYEKPLCLTIDPTGIKNWQGGYAYNYIIELPTSAKPIEFGTIKVDGWENGGDITLNVN